MAEIEPQHFEVNSQLLTSGVMILSYLPAPAFITDDVAATKHDGCDEEVCFRYPSKFLPVLCDSLRCQQ